MLETSSAVVFFLSRKLPSNARTVGPAGANVR